MPLGDTARSWTVGSLRVRGRAGVNCYDLPMLRRTRVISLFLLVACADESGQLRAEYGPDGSLAKSPDDLVRPNVVLISLDTLRADYLGAYGQALPTSPVLDDFAAESIVFERALSCSPWTTPAHLSLMTSLYPEAHGILDYPTPGVLDDRVATLAEILRAHGWQTAGFTEGGYAKGETGLGHGFETFPDWPHDDEGFISHELDPSRLLENAERALDWLAEAPEEPFFLFFHTYEPHYEYRPPLEYVQRIDPEFDHAREERRLIRALNAWNAREELTLVQVGILYRHVLQGGLRDKPVARQKALVERLERFAEHEWRASPGFEEDRHYIEMLYAAEILFTDEVVGRLFQRLRSMGVWEQSLILVTSDHGEGLLDHEELQHGNSLFDEQLHVPLIVRLPDGRRSGLRHSGQVRSVDVVPTVLDWIGLPAPRAAAGRSLLPLLDRDEPLPAFAEALTKPKRERNLKMVDDGRWKLVRNVQTGRELLFDLEEDPEELRDLVSAAPSSSAGAELDRLRVELERVARDNARRASELDVAPGEFSEAERRQLEALGYVGAEDD